MANSKFVLTVTTQESAQAVKDFFGLARQSPVALLNSIAGYFLRFVSGITASSTVVTTTAVAASGTVTFSSTGPVNDETMTVAGVTITAKTSATPGALEFTRSNTPNVDAVNLAALLNSHSSFTGIVSAEVTATGVVTITSAVPGTIGNAIGLTESMTNTAVSGALLTGGSQDATTTISHGV